METVHLLMETGDSARDLRRLDPQGVPEGLVLAAVPTAEDRHPGTGTFRFVGAKLLPVGNVEIVGRRTSVRDESGF